MEFDYHIAENAEPPHVKVVTADGENTLAVIYITDLISAAKGEELAQAIIRSLAGRYVFVQGSYDATYIGPFPSSHEAQTWLDKEKAAKPQFSFYLHTAEEMLANIREHGEINVYEP